MRRLMLFSLGFSLAVFISQYLHINFLFIPLMFAAILSAVLLRAVFRDARGTAALIALSGFSIGLAWNFFYTQIFFVPAQRLDGRTETVQMTVIDYPQQTERGYRVSVKTKASVPIKTVLYYTGDIPLVPGSNFTAAAEFSLPAAKYEDTADPYTSSGVFLTASLKGISDSGFKDSFVYLPAKAAHFIKNKLAELFSGEVLAMTSALITGDKQLLYASSFLYTAFSLTGISHIVAVSGMHLSFITGIMILLIRNKKLRFFLSLPVILFFMAMTGNTPSLIRAAVLQLMLLGAPLIKRETDNPTALSAALMLNLIINPFSAANVGLQLSFSSFLGIMLLSSRINEFFLRIFGVKKGGKLRMTAVIFISSSLSSTLSVTLFTTPLTALYFNSVSLIAPLANIAVLWAVSAVFTLSFVCCLAGFIYMPLAVLPAFVCRVLAQYIIFAAKLLAKFPYASVYTQSLFIRVWVCCVYLVILTFIISRKKPRLCASVGVCIGMLLFSFAVNSLLFRSSTLKLTALDVGQGQSLVFTSGSHAALIDCGGSADKNAGDIAAEYLLSTSFTKLDLVILTHYDSDHINGISKLFERMPPDLLVLPRLESESKSAQKIISLAKSKNTDIVYIEDCIGRFELGSAYFEVYPPVQQCLAVLAGSGSYEVLVTGDMAAEEERALIKNYPLPDIEVLVVGHHGSAYSTCDALLYALKPETAVISVGRDNSYGHPSPTVLKRLDKAGIAVYRTDLIGNVTVGLK